MAIKKRVVLHFPARRVDQPIIYKLAKEYDLVLNVLKASIMPNEEGRMVMELSGTKENYDKGIKFLQSTGVQIQSLGQDVIRNDERCTHCGVCVAVCPSGALTVDHKTRLVKFDSAECTACELCVLACPPRAMGVYL